MMLKYLIAAALATALIASPLTEALAQATAPAQTEKATAPAKKADKPLTPQQQKMQDCAAKWKEKRLPRKLAGAPPTARS
jgi:hypothetical protein